MMRVFISFAMIVGGKCLIDSEPILTYVSCYGMQREPRPFLLFVIDIFLLNFGGFL
jgi:hypothetical protein